MSITILGVPYNSDGTPPEVENPSLGIRDAGLIRLLESKAEKVNDLGDLSIPAVEGYRDPDTRILNVNAWRELSVRLSSRLAKLLHRDTFPVILGGDCAILGGIMNAFALEGIRPGLIYLDAHADFRKAELSPSGEAAELILTLLTGRGPEKALSWSEKTPLLKDEEIVVAGIREYDLIRESGVMFHNREAIRELGPDFVANEILGHFAKLGIRPWLHLDVDILDPSIMPVCFPELDGLTCDDLQIILRDLLASGEILGMDVTCYHPKMDPGRQAGARLNEILVDALTLITFDEE